jgi:hypothetical protein
VHRRSKGSDASGLFTSTSLSGTSGYCKVLPYAYTPPKTEISGAIAGFEIFVYLYLLKLAARRQVPGSSAPRTASDAPASLAVLIENVASGVVLGSFQSATLSILPRNSPLTRISLMWMACAMKKRVPMV